jgi:hypothetical protein
MKRLFVSILAIVVLLGIVRIIWSFVETGQFPNPLDDITSIVVTIQDWVGDTFKNGSASYGAL